MPTPDFILELRRLVGTRPLWLPGVTAVVVRGSHVLLVRRSDNHAWTPVCGIVEPGEHPVATAVREVLEETGVTCAVRRLASVSVTDEVVYANGDRVQYLDHTFRCDYLAGEAVVGDDESVDVRWWDLGALPSLSDDMRVRIDAAMSEESAARLD